MRKFISVLLVFAVLLTGCTFGNSNTSSKDTETSNIVALTESSDENITGTSANDNQSIAVQPSDYIDEEAMDLNFTSMSDPRLVDFIEAAVYSHLCDDLGKDVCIENIEAVYISQEYIDELTYNSKKNLFFGYTLKELDDLFEDQSYLFAVENGATVVQPRAPYDDSYDKMIRNVAIGTGVILICVVISVATYGAGAVAASAIFAASAKTGTIMALSSGAISGVTTGLVQGLTTGDWEQAKKEGAVAASEGFMVGAITGAITGGAGKAIELYSATANGLTMNEVAIIQKDSKYPIELIQEFESMDQYEIFRETGSFGKVIDGKMAIVRDIDLKYTQDGITNLERMQNGKAPIDPQTGNAYELHHMRQNPDGVLAILTREEHRGAGNFKTLHHIFEDSAVDHGAEWTKITKAFWQSYAATVV